MRTIYTNEKEGELLPWQKRKRLLRKREDSSLLYTQILII